MCPSPPAIIGQLRRLLKDGYASLVSSVRRGKLNRSLPAARAPIWEHTSERDGFFTFGDFPPVRAVDRLLDEQRYDGVEAAATSWSPPTDATRSPSPSAPSSSRSSTPSDGCTTSCRVRSGWLSTSTSPQAGLCSPPGSETAKASSSTRTTKRTPSSGAASICATGSSTQLGTITRTGSCLPPSIPIRRPSAPRQMQLGTDAGTWALAAGPWWPLTDVAVMNERLTVLPVNAHGQLHAEDEPAIAWPDGSRMWARDGNVPCHPEHPTQGCCRRPRPLPAAARRRLRWMGSRLSRRAWLPSPRRGWLSDQTCKGVRRCKCSACSAGRTSPSTADSGPSCTSR